MERSNRCTRIDDPDREVAIWLDNAVNDFRNRGLTKGEAKQQAAQALGISPRRAHAILYGQPFRVARTAINKLRDRYMAHLEQEAANLERRAAAAMARRRELGLPL
jgi:hypothetical protein